MPASHHHGCHLLAQVQVRLGDDAPLQRVGQLGGVWESGNERSRQRRVQRLKESRGHTAGALPHCRVSPAQFPSKHSSVQLLHQPSHLAPLHTRPGGSWWLHPRPFRGSRHDRRPLLPPPLHGRWALIVRLAVAVQRRPHMSSTGHRTAASLPHFGTNECKGSQPPPPHRCHAGPGTRSACLPRCGRQCQCVPPICPVGSEGAGRGLE